jgi:hypothetical protein
VVPLSGKRSQTLDHIPPIEYIDIMRSSVVIYLSSYTSSTVVPDISISDVANDAFSYLSRGRGRGSVSGKYSDAVMIASSSGMTEKRNMQKEGTSVGLICLTRRSWAQWVRHQHATAPLSSGGM